MAKQRMPRPQLCRYAAQLLRALEACGPPFLQSSTAAISVSQLEAYATRRAFLNLTTEMSHPLRAADAEPLSLTEARALCNGRLTDALCSILSRLPWKDFCTNTDALATHGSGFMLSSCALDCLSELLFAAHRVQPNTDLASELYDRCVFWHGMRQVLASQLVLLVTGILTHDSQVPEAIAPDAQAGPGTS